MKLIDTGLVGKQIKCPKCQCIAELEATDTWKETESDRPPAIIFSVECIQCNNNIPIVFDVYVGRGNRAYMTRNFVENAEPGDNVEKHDGRHGSQRSHDEVCSEMM